MKKRTMVAITIVIILIIGLISLFSFNKEKEISEEIKPTPEVLEFIDYYREWIDFDHPYVTCIFNKTCNGTFHLGMGASLKENISQIKEFLNKYGEVESIHTFDHYSISFKTDNIYRIGPILNSSFLSNIVLYMVRSDYKLASDKELHSCEIDADCVAVSGCCGCGGGGSNDLINKKYLDDWNAYYKLACSGTGCIAVMSNHWTCLPIAARKCINKTCTFVNYSEAPCDTPFYFSCRNEMPKSLWDVPYSDWSGQSYNLTCRKIINTCRGNMSQLEIFQKCMLETSTPKEYIKGHVVISFDSNATEEEIDNFISNSKLNAKRVLNDYYYEIRDSYPVVGFFDENKEEKSWELGGKPVQEFSNYLKSFPLFVKHVTTDYNLAHSLIVVEFYGNVSLEESEKLIKNYEKFEDFDSLKVFDVTHIGIIKIPEGEELEWICKLKDDEIIHQVNFKQEN